MGKLISRSESRRWIDLRSIRLAALVLLLVVMMGTFAVRADNPSPVGWNLSGGGFCGGDYTIFNTTLAPNSGIYAENCATGRNDFYSASDTGVVFNQVVAALKNDGPPATSGGAEIDFRSGQFSVVTSLVVNYSSFTIKGTSLPQPLTFGHSPSDPNSGGAYNTCNACGTVLIARTNGMTMMKSVAGTPIWTGQPGFASGCTQSSLDTHITGLMFDPNALAARGIDFRSCNNGNHSVFDDLVFGSTYATPAFSVAAMDISGCGECLVSHADFRLVSGISHDKIDLIWKDSAEVDDVIAYSDFQAGDTGGTNGFGLAMVLMGIDFHIIGCDIEGAIAFSNGSVLSTGQSYHFTDNFFNAGGQVTTGIGATHMPGPAHFWLNNSQAVQMIDIHSNTMSHGINSNGTLGVGEFIATAGAASVGMVTYGANMVTNTGIACQWKNNAVNILNLKSNGDNYVSGGGSAPCSNWGFTVTSGVF